MTIRYFGQDGLASLIREHVKLAHGFAAWVDESEDFERTAPAPLSAVCFRARRRGVNDEGFLEQLNARLMSEVNATGEVFLSHTKLRGLYTLRIAIGNIRTRAEHVERLKILLSDKLRLIMPQFSS
jgi:aromatic-L-amino-acid decarboxylase